MTTTTPKPATDVLVPVADPLFSVGERQARRIPVRLWRADARGIHAGPARQYAGWCTAQGLHLFAAGGSTSNPSAVRWRLPAGPASRSPRELP
jgi:hypothetical protein